MKYFYFLEKGVIVLGFENGVIGLLHLNDEKSKNWMNYINFIYLWFLVKEVVENILDDTGFNI